MTRQELIEKVARDLGGESHDPKELECLVEAIIEIVVQSEVDLLKAVSAEICKYNKLDPDGVMVHERRPVGWNPQSILYGFADAAKDAITSIRSCGQSQ